MGSIVAAFPWPSVSRTKVGKALKRASCRPYDRAITAETRLDGVDGLADRAQRRAERREEQQDVVVVGLRP